MEEKGGTELQVARTPNLDHLAEVSSCGLMEPVSPGITPGSGPSHFALFGYDPFQYNIGRGILEATGIDFPLTERDVVARINFATIDKAGKVIDRRAGRIPTEQNQRVCQKLQKGVRLDGGVEVLVQPVKEHRAVLVLGGKGFGERLRIRTRNGKACLPWKRKPRSRRRKGRRAWWRVYGSGPETPGG